MKRSQWQNEKLTNQDCRVHTVLIPLRITHYPGSRMMLLW